MSNSKSQLQSKLIQLRTELLNKIKQDLEEARRLSKQIEIRKSLLNTLQANEALP